MLFPTSMNCTIAAMPGKTARSNESLSACLGKKNIEWHTKQYFIRNLKWRTINDGIRRKEVALAFLLHTHQSEPTRWLEQHFCLVNYWCNKKYNPINLIGLYLRVPDLFMLLAFAASAFTQFRSKLLFSSWSASNWIRCSRNVARNPSTKKESCWLQLLCFESVIWDTILMRE